MIDRCLEQTSGGMPFGSPAVFASGYLRHIFALLGIRDVRMVQAERTRRGMVPVNTRYMT